MRIKEAIKIKYNNSLKQKDYYASFFHRTTPPQRAKRLNFGGGVGIFSYECRK